MAITQNEQTPRYLVRDQGEISGPFELNFIEGMVLGGVFPNTVELQKEGSGAWSRFRGVGHLSSSGIDVTVNSGDGRSGNSSVSPATKKPNSSSEVSWLGLVFGITAILAVVLFYIVASSKSDARKAADAQKSAETPKESVKWSNRASPIPPVKPIVEENTTIYRGANGQTYRVPNSAYSRLLSMQTDLRVTLGGLNTKEKELSDLSRKIENDRFKLDQTSQRQVDSFNDSVQTLNSRNQALRREFDSYNRKVDAFNSELERVGTRY